MESFCKYFGQIGLNDRKVFPTFCRLYYNSTTVFTSLTTLGAVSGICGS